MEKTEPTSRKFPFLVVLRSFSCCFYLVYAYFFISEFTGDGKQEVFNRLEVSVPSQKENGLGTEFSFSRSASFFFSLLEITALLLKNESR